MDNLALVPKHSGVAGAKAHSVTHDRWQFPRTLSGAKEMAGVQSAVVSQTRGNNASDASLIDRTRSFNHPGIKTARHAGA